MPANRKPRKKRQARPAGLPMMVNAPAVRAKYTTEMHLALEALRLGAGELEHVETIYHGALLAGELSRHVEHRTAIGEVVAAASGAALLAIDRFKRTGKWGLSGDDLAAFQASVTLADRLEALCSRREVRDAALAVCGMIGA